MSNGGSSRSTSSSFHFVAGLGSGVFTAVLLQPADLLKTRIQQAGSQHTSLLTTIRSIAASPDPVRQFWRGTAPSAIRTGLGSALYFGGLNELRQRLAQIEGLSSASARHGNGEASKAATTSSPSSSTSASGSSTLPRLSALANLTTGAVARASAGFAMMPITVIKVRFESSYYSYTTIASAAADILRKEGVRGFFAGFGATAVRDAPYAGLYVLFYEASKKRLSAVVGALDASSSSSGEGLGGRKGEGKGKGMSSTASAAVNFVSGIVAAVAGTAITNPFDAIKTRLQLQPGVYGNMVKAGRMMVRDEGVRSLFDGLGLRIGRKAVSSALAWTVYEELIRRAEMRWKDPVVL